MAIYDAIKACKNHVTIIVYGHAQSMGSIILQAPDKRVMAPNARLMLHYGSVGFSGHAKDGYKYMEENKYMDELMFNIFMEKIKAVHPAYSMSKLKEKTNFDWFMGAQEALELGLIDEILTDEE